MTTLSIRVSGVELAVWSKAAKAAGYDGLEISAIGRMREHLVLDRWREDAPRIKDLSAQYEIPLLAMEQPSRDADVMEEAMQAAVAIGIPIINCGPGGTAGDEESLKESIESLIVKEISTRQPKPNTVW